MTRSNVLSFKQDVDVIVGQFSQNCSSPFYDEALSGPLKRISERLYLTVRQCRILMVLLVLQESGEEQHASADVILKSVSHINPDGLKCDLQVLITRHLVREMNSDGPYYVLYPEVWKKLKNGECPEYPHPEGLSSMELIGRIINLYDELNDDLITPATACLEIKELLIYNEKNEFVEVLESYEFGRFTDQEFLLALFVFVRFLGGQDFITVEDYTCKVDRNVGSLMKTLPELFDGSSLLLTGDLLKMESGFKLMLTEQAKAVMVYRFYSDFA